MQKTYCKHCSGKTNDKIFYSSKVRGFREFSLGLFFGRKNNYHVRRIERKC